MPTLAERQQNRLDKADTVLQSRRLTWQHTMRTGEVITRTGMVWSPGPRVRTQWVTPDEALPTDTYRAILVRQHRPKGPHVASDECADTEFAAVCAAQTRADAARRQPATVDGDADGRPYEAPRNAPIRSAAREVRRALHAAKRTQPALRSVTAHVQTDRRSRALLVTLTGGADQAETWQAAHRVVTDALTTIAA